MIAPCLAYAMAAGCATVDEDRSYPDRITADVSRERYFEAIFNRPAEGWVRLTPDLQAARHIIEPSPAAPVTANTQEPPALDFSRIFSGGTVSAGDLFTAIEATTPYRFVVAPSFDRTQRFSLNDQYNRIDDILVYAGHKTNASMTLFMESRQILVVPLSQEVSP